MRLLESNATRRRGRGGTVVSVLLHTAIIFGAVVATARARPVASKEPPPDHVVWSAPPPAHTTTPTHGASSRSRSSTNAMTERPPTIAPPVSIDIGPVPEPTVGLDPARDLAGAFTNGLPTAGCHDCASGGATSGDVRDAFHVERAATPLNAVRPRYPETLRAAGVSGRVVAQFVVDTLGRVEPGSVQLTSATHPLFGDAAHAAIGELRFRPAEAGGRRVRQLVALPFEFVVR